MSTAFKRTGPSAANSAIWSLVFILSAHCYGQGTIHFRFDGPPIQPPGTGVFVQQYFETGMWFRPLGVVGPGNGFDRRRGGGAITFIPDNGTSYLAAAIGDSLMFSFSDGRLFDLTSVDLAEYSTVVPAARSVPFVGYRFDGSIVTATFTTDGIIDGVGPVADFQTFYFDLRFTGLSRVEIPAYGWSLDNLMVSVPEPSSAALLLTSVLIALAARAKR